MKAQTERGMEKMMLMSLGEYFRVTKLPFTFRQEPVPGTGKRRCRSRTHGYRRPRTANERRMFMMIFIANRSAAGKKTENADGNGSNRKPLTIMMRGFFLLILPLQADRVCQKCPSELHEQQGHKRPPQATFLRPDFPL